MEKNYDLKNDPRYGKTHLCRKIDESIKRQRDDLLEWKETPAKGFGDHPGIDNRDPYNDLKRNVNRSFTDS